MNDIEKKIKEALEKLGAEVEVKVTEKKEVTVSDGIIEGPYDFDNMNLSQLRDCLDELEDMLGELEDNEPDEEKEEEHDRWEEKVSRCEDDISACEDRIDELEDSIDEITG